MEATAPVSWVELETNVDDALAVPGMPCSTESAFERTHQTAMESAVEVDDDQGDSWIGRAARRTGAFVTAVGLTGAALFGQSAVYEAEAAPSDKTPSCYGDYCSGQDPNDTGCADESAHVRTLETVYLDDDRTGVKVSVSYGPFSAEPGAGIQGGHDGRLELRYSPECGTVWTRLQTLKTMGFYGIGIQDRAGYDQEYRTSGHDGATTEGEFYSPMMYARGKEAQAYIYDFDRCGINCPGGKYDPVETFWAEVQ